MSKLNLVTNNPVGLVHVTSTDWVNYKVKIESFGYIFCYSYKARLLEAFEDSLANIGALSVEHVRELVLQEVDDDTVFH